jgi:hypothetical protein
VFTCLIPSDFETFVLSGLYWLWNATLLHYFSNERPPLWSSGQSSWLQNQGYGFDSRRYQKSSKCTRGDPKITGIDLLRMRAFLLRVVPLRSVSWRSPATVSKLGSVLS